MNIEDIKNFIKNRVFRRAGSYSSQSNMKFNAYDYVDLDLSSGTKWATCNVGANKPWESGNYYAWGETKPKECYDWNTYLDGNISMYFFDCGTNKDLLKDVSNIANTQYDAAKANWDDKWCMPTREQQNELCNECYWVWTENYNSSNVKGYIVYKAKTLSDRGRKIYSDKTPSSSYTMNDAHIFLPAAGYHYYGGSCGVGSYGFYWSSSLRDPSNPSFAWCIDFDSDDVHNTYDYRYYGYTVRPVLN